MNPKNNVNTNTGKISNTEKWSLQSLVDEHARFGMSNSAIKTHLREAHGIPATELIPPPTTNAQRDRDRFRTTGQISTAIKSRLISSSPNANGGSNSKFSREGIEPSANEDSATPILPTVTQERADEVVAKMIAEHPEWKGMKIKVHGGDSEEDRIDQLIADSYQSTGPTLLDRLIHGMAKITPSAPGQRSFEVVVCLLRDRMLNGDFDRRAPLFESQHPFQLTDMVITPWLIPEAPSTNLQMSAEMAEIFAKGKAPRNGDWFDAFHKGPVYIDIAESRRGVRSLSGIFCRPSLVEGIFEWAAMVEWTGQGYEAWICGTGSMDASKGAQDEFSVHSFTGEEDVSESAVKVLEDMYRSMAEQVVKIAKMAVTFLHSQRKMGENIQTLQTFDDKEKTGKAFIGRTASSKKIRNQEKTHSYFVVRRMDLPKDRFGFNGTTGNAWSLDHIVSVSGHLRWQPWGPGMSRRKLIWIENYEKGTGDRVRPSPSPALVKIPDH